MIYERRTSCDPNKAFSKLLIVYKITNPKAFEFAKEIIEYLLIHKNVCLIYIEKEYFELFNDYFSKNQEDKDRLFPFNIDDKIDLCIVLGGDGTVLWANSLFKGRPRPPFLTFNLGTLGYMSYYDINEYKDILDCLYGNHNNMFFEKRSTLKATIETNNEQKELYSLNDIVIQRGESSHPIAIDIFLNEQELTTVKGDGLIVSTSTGSTAYSLSAGGSIVHYDVDCLIINSICPHTLSFRAMVLPKDIIITLKINENSKTVVLNNDGLEHVSLHPGDIVKIQLYDQYVNLLVLENFHGSPLKLWKTKINEQLGWNSCPKSLN